jgi:hypothetical protein
MAKFLEVSPGPSEAESSPTKTKEWGGGLVMLQEERPEVWAQTWGQLNGEKPSLEKSLFGADKRDSKQVWTGRKVFRAHVKARVTHRTSCEHKLVWL